ncbi:HemK2/MTQ2 family protein methyltransferase [Streptomyces sp. ITFR-16]|uniref:HemK2/MTQ2 family protein methyltransferase n=1 Tax=Streptomyces sp. ITFR-16 TaxID=3075198 RepID=UPI0028895563|nr:HemK2/MTQ2 family protein methyltransferase [Streptomyces sp. ITFR-16]WNI26584.1 class I SAM-dependent methyltransferase [Streptomyces sp. ITFR-16]
MAAGIAAGPAGQVRPLHGVTIRLPGVYRAQADTALLASAMHREGIGPGTDVLDLCTGSGALALCAARLGARVTAVDISRRAVASARLNAALARLPVSVHRGDLLSLFPGRRFDMLVSNPPYVPAPSGTVPRRGAGRAWDAGFDGRILIDRICDLAPSALRPGGVLLLVHSELSRPEETVRRLSRAGLNTSVSARTALPFGPVTRARLPWLRARGLVPSGADQEELVIVRARKE